jgi:two-component system chemotaxis response regulator CheY
MFNSKDELAKDFLADSCEDLASIETDLLDIESAGAAINIELVNRVFRAIHSIKGGASVFDLSKVHQLAHGMEGVLAQIRSRKVPPTPERISALLLSTDKLHELLLSPETSNEADIAEIVAQLAVHSKSARRSTPQLREAEPIELHPTPARPLLLVVEDDFASRLVLQTFLARIGECHVAVNGVEAVEAVRATLEHGRRYDLICMDIMMPEMDGREAVRQIRELEEAHGILSTYGSKIVMTTAVDEVKEVIRCFQVLCDSYLTKPIDLAKLNSLMHSYQLIP